MKNSESRKRHFHTNRNVRKYTKLAVNHDKMQLSNLWVQPMILLIAYVHDCNRKLRKTIARITTVYNPHIFATHHVKPHAFDLLSYVRVHIDTHAL
jgi:hypothetical protein